eukprot:6175835-Pleurochrysis_carterae.AAC.7
MQRLATSRTVRTSPGAMSRTARNASWPSCAPDKNTIMHCRSLRGTQASGASAELRKRVRRSVLAVEMA